MKIKEPLSLHAAPLLLRIAVGVVFLWAGSVKLFTTTTYSGDDARLLIELGVVAGAADPATPVDTTEPREAEASQEEAAADAAEDASADQTGDAGEEIGEAVDAVAGELEEKVDEVATTLEEQVDDIVTAVEESIAKDLGADAVVARRLYSITLLLHRASHPEEGRGSVWCSRMSSPGWVTSLAWLAALTECVGGVLILIGLLTRIWALGLAMTMVVAMATTTIGPAMQSGGALLGFLPALRLDEPGGAWVRAWRPWLFQLSLLMSCLALVCTGAGALSIDRRVLGKKSGSTRHSSKPPAPHAPGAPAKDTKSKRPF